jgi:hypothetical protein
MSTCGAELFSYHDQDVPTHVTKQRGLPAVVHFWFQDHKQALLFWDLNT